MNPTQNIPADVREIQEYLRELGRTYQTIPPLSADGLYGDETAEAVREFQRLLELPQTGEVDSATWNALVAEYHRLSSSQTQPRPIYPFPKGDGALEVGDSGPAVTILQALLDTLALYYINFPAVIPTAQFGAETETAVKAAQAQFGFEQTGRVDRRTWDMLANTYNAYVGR